MNINPVRGNGLSLGLLLILILALSATTRLYFLTTWDQIPTSDPYHFIGWTSGVDQSSHLDFPGSEDRAYGQYPDGYPILLQFLSTTGDISLVPLSKFLPVIVGSMCTLPVFLVFRKLTRRSLYQLAGTVMVVFSLAFLKYTSVSIPNMMGLYLFCLAAWIALRLDRQGKRMLAMLGFLVLAVSRIHYLSLVCIGVLLAIVISRKLMVRASGQEFDPRRMAFILIVALVAGILAWTAAYRVMYMLYGIDITSQPPARLSLVLSFLGYPLIFGVLQILFVPLGLIHLAKDYISRHFTSEDGNLNLDPVLILALFLVFLLFASGFLKVEYYPFRFNCFLILPLVMVSILGLLLARGLLMDSPLRAFAWMVIPLTVLMVIIQPLAASIIPFDDGEPFLPWEQEYGETEMPALRSWMEEKLLCTEFNRSGGPESKSLPRREMVMADWVRSRALNAFGFDSVHIHWWFFQGWYDLQREPFRYRSLDIYAGNSSQALDRLAGLYLRKATGSTGDWYYHYKYIYTSKWLGEVMVNDFGLQPNFTKFDNYDGSLLYDWRRSSSQGDRVIAESERALGAPYMLPPFDRLYSSPGVGIYLFPDLKRVI